jgi:hypothetical protein
MKSIIDKIRLIESPKSRERKDLVKKMFKGNKSAKNRLIEMHLRCALRISFELSEEYSMPLNELFPEAVVGLIEAISRKVRAKNYLMHIYSGIHTKVCNYIRKNNRQFLSYEEYCDKIRDKAYYDGEALMSRRIYLEQLEHKLDAAMDYILTDGESTVITLRFGLGDNDKHSHQQIADMFMTDKKKIQKMERHALYMLKRIYKLSDELEEFL